MREMELLKNLRATPKAFFTISDLEKITGLDRNSLYVSEHRPKPLNPTPKVAHRHQVRNPVS